MNKFLSSFTLLLGLVNFIYSDTADHLLLSTICTDPNNAEMIQIYNPTDDIIYLNDPNVGAYYLTDGNKPSSNKYYYNFPLENNYWSSSTQDFIITFPEGDSISPYETITIGMHTSEAYEGYYSLSSSVDYNLEPDYNLYDLVNNINCSNADNSLSCSNFDGCYWDNINDCINFYDIDFSILGVEETLILFFWDGNPDHLVKDVDYVSWGGLSEASNKSGITLGSNSFNNETSVQDQSFLEGLEIHQLYSRVSYDEFESLLGNGQTGDDETSEDFNLTWEIKDIPGISLGCTNIDAANYSYQANIDDGSCYVPDNTITNVIQSNLDLPFLENCNLANSLDDEFQDESFIRAKIIAKVVGYKDYPMDFLVLEDANGYRVDATNNFGNWYVSNAVSEGFDPVDSSDDLVLWDIVDATNPKDYIIGAEGIFCNYRGKYQFEIYSANDIVLIEELNTHGIRTDEDEAIINAKIETKPYVIIPSRGERLDFKYSFPSESRVIIRIFNLNGDFLTSLVDQYYDVGGTIERYEDESSWDGRDHLGQLVQPGTYLMHIEATNFKTGKTSTDITPIVVGAYQ